jgi:hypothetical protein
MEPDLKALASTVRPFPSVDELKQLPILYVLELAGAEIEVVDGRYTCCSPFRPDRRPSFDIYGDKLERWGDLAEGTSGDVLDLIGRFIDQLDGGHTFIEVKDEAARLLKQFQALSPPWAGPREQVRKPFDLDKAKAFVDHLRTTDYGGREAINKWLDDRRGVLCMAPAEWLMGVFRVSWDTERLVIPYYNRADELCAYKTRKPGEPVISTEGAEYDQLLYGLWRDTDPERIVVLCEGESDVWSGTYAAPEGYVFLGLPTGAGSRPVQAQLLTGRRVILAFDGDPAGRGAILPWAEALLNVQAQVRICLLPDKKDLAQLDATMLAEWLSTRIRRYE